MWNLHDAETSLKLIEKLKEKASELGLSIKVTGKIVLCKMVNYIVSSFFRSIGLALVLISIMLMIVLKVGESGFFSFSQCYSLSFWFRVDDYFQFI